MCLTSCLFVENRTTCDEVDSLRLKKMQKRNTLIPNGCSVAHDSAVNMRATVHICGKPKDMDPTKGCLHRACCFKSLKGLQSRFRYCWTVYTV